MQLAPVVLFVYARPEHTKKMVESLSENSLAKDSEVWIFSDAAKNEKAELRVKKVREYIHSIERLNYFKSVHIIEAEDNKGLANSVISGVSKVIKEYKKLIVIEDDLKVTDNFLEYMNEALDFYKDDSKIWSISGYNLPIKITEDYKEDVYLAYRACSWGWATWEDRWNTIDWNVSDYKKFKYNLFKRNRFNRGGADMAVMLDSQMRGSIDSWAIRWCYEQYKQDKYTIYPVKSLVYNMGLDSSGTHSGTTDAFSVEISNDKRKLKKDLQLNHAILKNFRSKFRPKWKVRIKNILVSIGLEGVVKFASGRKYKR